MSLSGVRSIGTGGGLLACSPNSCPFVVAAPDVNWPHLEASSVLGFPAYTDVTPTPDIATIPKTINVCIVFIFKCNLLPYGYIRKPDKIIQIQVIEKLEYLKPVTLRNGSRKLWFRFCAPRKASFPARLSRVSMNNFNFVVAGTHLKNFLATIKKNI